MIMSTQSYYKDRLGFDPREALYESSGGSNGGATTIKTGTRRVVQQHHYSSTTQQHSNGSGGGGGYYSNSPAKKLKQSIYSSNTAISSGTYVSSGGGGGGAASPGTNINANIAAITSKDNNQGDGYEDALTQFKGTMSIWDYFVENWDASGTDTSTITVLPRVSVFCETKLKKKPPRFAQPTHALTSTRNKTFNLRFVSFGPNAFFIRF